MQTKCEIVSCDFLYFGYKYKNLSQVSCSLKMTGKLEEKIAIGCILPFIPVAIGLFIFFLVKENYHAGIYQLSFHIFHVFFKKIYT